MAVVGLYVSTARSVLGSDRGLNRAGAEACSDEFTDSGLTSSVIRTII